MTFSWIEKNAKQQTDTIQNPNKKPPKKHQKTPVPTCYSLCSACAARSSGWDTVASPVVVVSQASRHRVLVPLAETAIRSINRRRYLLSSVKATKYLPRPLVVGREAEERVRESGILRVRKVWVSVMVEVCDELKLVGKFWWGSLSVCLALWKLIDKVGKAHKVFKTFNY